MMYHPPHKAGFTLVEMAVVLVIIALITGGIMMGKAIITQAEIRAVIGEYDHYLKAVQEFQDQFQALPGDMNNATSYWGTAATCPPVSGSGPATIPITSSTCNGNGDGLIGNCTDDGATMTCGDSYKPEVWATWKHLSNAALVAGRYNGVGSSVSNLGATVSYNVPASKSKGAGWTLVYLNNYHVFLFGGANSGTYTTEPLLAPADAFEIDRKLDDGNPITGDIRAWLSGRWDTAATSLCYNAGTAKYYTASEAAADPKLYKCSLIFYTGF